MWLRTYIFSFLDFLSQSIAGFNFNDSMSEVRYTELPGSGTLEVLSLVNSSNVGIDGLWVFRVDTNEIIRKSFLKGYTLIATIETQSLAVW